MIKVLNARLLDAFRLELDFSDQTQGVFDAAAYLASRSGPLLDKLRDPAYFSRCFHHHYGQSPRDFARR